MGTQNVDARELPSERSADNSATTPRPDPTSEDLPCHRCGYDLRAHPQEGKCPECGASVAESRRWAAIPRRPAWRDSDRRWRRRMLAGAWLLVLLPLMDALPSAWTASVPVPSIFGAVGIHTLDETLLYGTGVYLPLIFCMGVVLLFAKERGRRRGPLDWTRRWGVLCSYVVLLLAAAPTLFISALVLIGISALFLSMPLQYQPGVTKLFVVLSTDYVYYGPQPKAIALVVLVVFTSITILLACIALFDALRSTGLKHIWVMLTPLALFSLYYLARAGLYCFGASSVTQSELIRYEEFFSPRVLVAGMVGIRAGLKGPGSVHGVDVLAEALKWCLILTIAVWLSIAQLAAWRKGGGKGSSAREPHSFRPKKNFGQ